MNRMLQDDIDMGQEDPTDNQEQEFSEISEAFWGIVKGTAMSQ